MAVYCLNFAVDTRSYIYLLWRSEGDMSVLKIGCANKICRAYKLLL